MKVFVPHIRLEIPLFVMFRALGIITDKDIIKHIVYDIDDESNKEIINWIQPSVFDGHIAMTKEDAIDYLIKGISILGQPKDIKLDKQKKISYLKTMIEKDFLPHMGPNFKDKAYYLGYMVNKLSKCFLNKISYDRDSYTNKRIETSGMLMSAIYLDNISQN